jgi:putative acetyltransferase
MSDYRIRHLEPEDAAALRELTADESVYGNTLQLPNPSLQMLERRFHRLLRPGRYQLICESASGEVLGHAGLWRFDEERLGHIGGLGIVVRRDWQGRGVGSALMAALTDLADNWLGLRRIELVVYADNLHAQALYRKFGFVEEARMRAHSLRGGAYHDSLLMGRLHPGG